MNTTDLQACHMSLYPTKDSLLEAVQYIEAQAPIQPHQVFPLLMMYQNTLLAELAKAAQDTPPRRPVPLHVVQ